MPINTVNQDQELGIISSEFFTIYYRNSSGSWVNIPGAQDVNITGSQSPTRDVIPANGAVSKRVGRTRTPEVSLNCYYMPTDVAWRALRDAQLNRTTLRFRIDWDADLIFKSHGTDSKAGKVAVNATGGVMTFSAPAAGTGNDPKLTVENDGLGRGQMVLVYGADEASTKYYIITGVSNASTPVITCAEIDSDNKIVAATTQNQARFKLFNPAPHRLEFSAQVTQGSDMDMGAESEMMTNLTLAPRRQLPGPHIVRILSTTGD